MWKSYADIGICQATDRPGVAATMTCIAVPEEGEGDQPAFGLADLVVDSLLDVTDASLDALERALGPATR